MPDYQISSRIDPNAKELGGVRIRTVNGVRVVTLTGEQAQWFLDNAIIWPTNVSPPPSEQGSGPLAAHWPLKLLDAAGASGDWIEIGAGRFQISFYGSFNGASATLQFSPDGGTTAIDTIIAGVSENSIAEIEAVMGRYRVALAGGASPSITADIRPLN